MYMYVGFTSTYEIAKAIKVPEEIEVTKVTADVEAIDATSCTTAP